MSKRDMKRSFDLAIEEAASSSTRKTRRSTLKVVPSDEEDEDPSWLESDDTSHSSKSLNDSIENKKRLSAPCPPLIQPNLKQPPRHTYSKKPKRISNGLSSLSDCADLPQNHQQLQLIPDRVQLIRGSLPLRFELTSSSSRVYLFRQIVEEQDTNGSGFSCLLCVDQSLNFGTEKELQDHYTYNHDIHVEKSPSTVDYETKIYLCLHESLIKRPDGEVAINEACSLCPASLPTLRNLKEHYRTAHRKTVTVVDQEELMKMHQLFYCSQCPMCFETFADLHQHSQATHKLYTLICKRCPFMSQNENRLKKHFEEKHLSKAESAIQNLKCDFCSLLLLGKEALTKHIIEYHFVQTSTESYSCLKCLQQIPAPPTYDLLSEHSINCSKSLEPNRVEAAHTNGKNHPASENQDAVSEIKEEEKAFNCRLCNQKLIDKEKYQIHLIHRHGAWLERLTCAYAVELEDGTMEYIQCEDPNTKPTLSLAEFLDDASLEEAGIGVTKNYFCFHCDTLIGNYRLYYLHMYNVHRLEKYLKCKISTCEAIFMAADEFEDHIASTGHSQASVFDNCIDTIACHICNVYLADLNELVVHHLSDEHCDKFAQLSPKAPPQPLELLIQNYQCQTCKAKFGLLDSYIHHMETEKHNQPCSHCGLCFASNLSRHLHIEKEHPEKSCICEVCHVKQEPDTLFNHLVQHKVVFECEFCHSIFYEADQLNMHLNQHRETTCPWPAGCKSQISMANLSSHISKHRAQANTKCTICQKTFNSPASLKAHMDVHAKADSQAQAILKLAVNSIST